MPISYGSCDWFVWSGNPERVDFGFYDVGNVEGGMGESGIIKNATRFFWGGRKNQTIQQMYGHWVSYNEEFDDILLHDILVILKNIVLQRFEKKSWAFFGEWCHIFWSNYSDLTRPHPKWWFSKGNPLISEKPRLVKYNNLARYNES